MSKQEVLFKSSRDLEYDAAELEELLIKIGDKYEIRIAWSQQDTNLTAFLAVVGGTIGAYKHGMKGALGGAVTGAAAGVAVVSLKNLWPSIKSQLKSLLDLVYNHLKKLSVSDYIEAAQVILANSATNTDLVKAIINIIARTLNKEVTSNIT